MKRSARFINLRGPGYYDMSEPPPLSNTAVIPTVVVNHVANAVGTVNGRPFQIELEGGATHAFGISKGRLAYRVDEDFYILNLQSGERMRTLPDYRVVNTAWDATGTGWWPSCRGL